MILPSGDNCIVVDPSANMGLTASDLERAEAVMARADAVSTVLEIPLEVVEATLRLGRRLGKLTVLDAVCPQALNQKITDDVLTDRADKGGAPAQARDSHSLVGSLAAGEKFQIGGQQVLARSGQPFALDHHVKICASHHHDVSRSSAPSHAASWGLLPGGYP